VHVAAAGSMIAAAPAEGDRLSCVAAIEPRHMSGPVLIEHER
jgi:hypothetical protein